MIEINIDTIEKRVERFYENYEVEIQIVDHCNLNCQGCNHLSCLAEPWFMPLTEFKETFDLILKNLPNVKKIMILGGEPFLHPNFVEILEYVKKANLHNKQIDVLSNGIVLDQNPNFYLDLIKDSRIHFSITSYPYIKYKNLNKFEDIHYLASRLFFQAPVVDAAPNEKSNYLSCSLYKIPCLFIKDLKVFICPLTGCNNIMTQQGFNIKLYENKDYLDLRSITEEKIVEFIKNENKTMCYHCNSRCESHYWAQGKTLKSQLIGKFNSYNGYYLDYEKYNELYNGTTILKSMFSNRGDNLLYKDTLDYNYMINGWKYDELQKINKKLDIIIPYYHIDSKLIDQLINTLLNQTAIAECQIYLISDCSSYDYEVLNKFKKHFTNVSFFKTKKNSGPGIARQIGIDNSFSEYFTFLDCDDEYNYPDALKDMIEIAYSTKADLIISKTNECVKGLEYQKDDSYDKEATDDHPNVFKREFVDKCGVRFNNLSSSEDKYFNKAIRFFKPNEVFLKKYTYKYNKGIFNKCIGTLTTLEEKITNYYEALYLILENYYLQEPNNPIITESISEIYSMGKFLEGKDVPIDYLMQTRNLYINKILKLTNNRKEEKQ